MKKTKLLILSIAVALCMLTTAQASTFYLEGDLGDQDPGATGQLQVYVDTAPEGFTYVNGGISLSVQNSQPGVIAFTAAEVLAPEFFGGFVKRWTSVSVENLQADHIGDLFALSLDTAGLDPAIPDNADPTGTTRFLYATIDYQVVGAGLTAVDVDISQRPDPLVDRGENVVQFAQFIGGEISVIPEPATLMLAACIGLVGIAAGRRNRY